MPAPAPATTRSSGAWPERTWTMATWMGVRFRTSDKTIMDGTRTFVMLPLAVAAIACGGGEPSKSIVVTNPLDADRHELVAVPYGEFLSAFGTDDSPFRVVNAENGTEIPYQLETKGTGSPQNILLYVAVPAGGDVTLAVEKSPPAPVTTRTFARYVPERYDDFAWENEVVAFRM